ncbi:MAG TPA: DUF72 domain-containing protein [Edaphocola sp.]|nr:DUF72 domain-containing protein [Edaphocola sp.]
MTYYIGCSGYYYKEWKGNFYPGGLTVKDWLKFYCQQFNTLEINSSFYRMPSPASLQRWRQESPDGFLFSIKAPRIFTHLKQFRMDRKEIRAFYDLVSAGLKEKLGCILFQMPPSFSFTPERLQSICEQLDPGLNNVVEFRHESWWRREIFDTLQRYNIIFCGQSYPGNLPDIPVVNNKIIYYRFHGKPVLYRSTYKEEALQRVLNEMSNGRHNAFIYFNNTWGGAAIINGKQMQELTGTKK